MRLMVTFPEFKRAPTCKNRAGNCCIDPEGREGELKRRIYKRRSFVTPLKSWMEKDNRNEQSDV